MHGQSRPVQNQAGPSRKTALMVVATSKVVRFGGRVQSEGLEDFFGNQGSALLLVIGAAGIR